MKIDLEKLEALAKAATPVPWRHEPDDNFFDHDCQIIKGDTAFVCEFVTEKNAALKWQKDEAIHYILSNEGASMIDCRMCFFVSSCECGPKQCDPNREMCEQAVRKAIEEAGE